jgi:hypothetical protein
VIWHTLNVGNGLLQDLAQNPGVLQLLLDPGNQSIGQLLLLALLDLSLIPNPRVENRLGLMDELSALLQLVGFGLVLGSLLQNCECLT